MSKKVFKHKISEAVASISEKLINYSSKDYSIKSNKKNEFIVNISFNSIYLILNGKYKDINSIWHNYSSQKTIQEIQNNRYFGIFDTLEEIYKNYVLY